jgi:outer membrane protein assembly factor BamB
MLWGRGVWGSMATWQDEQQERWLFMPMWGPPAKNLAHRFQNSYGAAEQGSIMAFRLTVENDKPAVAPVWISADMHVPDPPVVANGVVYAVATGENTRQGGYFPPEIRARPRGNAILYAFDARTGKMLYSSGDLAKSWAHFGGPAVSKGQVYFTTWDAKVYAFGLGR